jgi:hypothetical protein
MMLKQLGEGTDGFDWVNTMTLSRREVGNTAVSHRKFGITLKYSHGMLIFYLPNCQ